MTNLPQNQAKTLWFPLWNNVLQSEATLTPGLRQSYRRTIAGFLAFCRQRQAAASAPLAREYMEIARLQDNPVPARLQERKDALNWFFRRGREARSPLRDVPKLARSDLGRFDWEQGLIAKLRLKHVSWRTEQTYRGWLWRFARFLNQQPVDTAGGAEARAFLTKLAVEERASAASQKQAVNALAFYFREVADKDPGDFGDFARARKRVRTPVVLSRAECDRLFAALEGTPRLMAELMFGGGLRLLELLRLRVHPVR